MTARGFFGPKIRDQNNEVVEFMGSLLRSRSSRSHATLHNATLIHGLIVSQAFTVTLLC